MVDNDPERMSLAELTSLPDNAMPAGALTEIWSRRASLTAQQNADELAREMDPNYTGPRLLTAGHVSQAEILARQRETALREYEETMSEVHDRSQILLDRIDEQMRQDQDRMRKIEQNAIHLHDGRAVYADNNGKFRDGQGTELQGEDAVEAQKLHQQKPDASTWDQKNHTQEQLSSEEQLREKVQKLHDGANSTDDKSLSDTDRDANSRGMQNELADDEKEFSRRVDNTDGALPSEEKLSDDTFGGDDYMAAYSRSTSSHASALDGQQTKALSAVFTPAAAGQGPGVPPTVDPSRPAPDSAAVKALSR